MLLQIDPLPFLQIKAFWGKGYVKKTQRGRNVVKKTPEEEQFKGLGE